MIYRLAADGLLLLHLGFVLFALFGGLLVAWRRGFIYLHLPAAGWAVAVELIDGSCPLTSWEKLLRQRAGDSGYSEGFIEHYLLPVLYPSWLTLPVQYVLIAVVIATNVAVYAWVWARRRRRLA
jgi:hypothetical protein